jgi:hypothetical protein
MSAFLSSLTGGFKSLTADPADPAAVAEADKAKRALTDFLARLLNAENLAVLSGLGTSMCVKNVEGNSLAPTMKDLWDATVAAAPNLAAIRAKVNHAGREENIELLLTHCQLAQALQNDDEVKQFIQNTERLIVEKCGFDPPEQSLATHEAFLRAVARRSAKKARARIFTTNYDRCFEAAAARANFVVVDGFSFSVPSEFDGGLFDYDIVRRGRDGAPPDFISNVFHLYKLHGSVTWERDGNRLVKKSAPANPVLVYPRYNKFESSYEPPFIEMMARFQAALRGPNAGLLVIGAGFNDNHITQPILSAVMSNVTLRCVIVAPNIDNPTSPALKTITSLIENGDARIALVKGKFEDFVPFVPDVRPMTEDEMHQARVKAATEV